MKTILLALIMTIGLAGVIVANDSETVTLKQGKKKSAAKGDFTLKFVSVAEDSRCPADAQCVWAGNAVVNVMITDRQGVSKTMAMNTGRGPAGDQYRGWAIYLTELTPVPKSGSKIKQKAYTATFTIRRLTR